MDRLLKPNICGLEPEEWRQDRLRRIQHGVSPCPAYACTYWASHLVAALKEEAVLDDETTKLVESFASRHLLT